jgi:hypothetical protein
MTNQSDYVYTFIQCSARDLWERVDLSSYDPEPCDPPYQSLRLGFVRLGSVLHSTSPSPRPVTCNFGEGYNTQQPHPLSAHFALIYKTHFILHLTFARTFVATNRLSVLFTHCTHSCSFDIERRSQNCSYVLVVVLTTLITYMWV